MEATGGGAEDDQGVDEGGQDGIIAVNGAMETDATRGKVCFD